MANTGLHTLVDVATELDVDLDEDEERELTDADFVILSAAQIAEFDRTLDFVTMAVREDDLDWSGFLLEDDA